MSMIQELIRVDRAPERDSPRSLGFYAFRDDANLAIFVSVDKTLAFAKGPSFTNDAVRDIAGRSFAAEIRQRDRAREER